jgi:cytochrome c biogenesis factor
MNLIIGLTILLFGIPVGYGLRYFTKEEMKIGKNYFGILFFLSLLISVVVFFTNIDIEMKKTIIFSFLFISIVSFISWKDGKIFFTKKGKIYHKKYSKKGSRISKK